MPAAAMLSRSPGSRSRPSTSTTRDAGHGRKPGFGQQRLLALPHGHGQRHAAQEAAGRGSQVLKSPWASNQSSVDCTPARCNPAITPMVAQQSPAIDTGRWPAASAAATSAASAS